MIRGEIRQTLLSPEPQHALLTPSEKQVRILRKIVLPAAAFLSVADAEFIARSAIGADAIRHQFLGTTVVFRRFLEEFQLALLVARLRHEALEQLSLVVDCSPKASMSLPR